MKRSLQQQGFAVHQVYGENYSAGFFTPYPASWRTPSHDNPVFDDCERQYVAEILNLPLREPLPVVRVLFERLKRNSIICTVGDGTLGWSSVRKKFLGGERVFYTGMVSLSRSTGAPILPVFCIQESKDTITVIVESPINVDFDMDRTRAAELCIERYVSLLEGHTKKHPGQYYNWHLPAYDRGRSTEIEGLVE